jgi:spermidine/putrescine transport system permease protein
MAAGLTSPVRAQESRTRGFWLALPAALWLGVFFLLPLIIVFVVSFMTRGDAGSPDLPLTFDHYQRVFGIFSSVIYRSVWIALVTTIICLIAGYPIAFYIRLRRTTFGRQFALFLVILPFWTNFLVRTYAWRMLLAREGIINGVLLDLGLITESIQMLNTPFAVILGQVYGFLPFMVLPIYATVERFDFRFVEAARDLGANDWHTFWRVVLPITLPGVIAGCILVFIPSISAFLTPDLLGGRQGLMIGNLIYGQFPGNLPLGAALSMVLMLMVMISLVVYVRFADRKG